MGREGPTIAIIRGLKVRVSVLDRFLSANGVEETYGLAPFYDVNPDKQSQLLRFKVGGGDARTQIVWKPKRRIKAMIHLLVLAIPMLRLPLLKAFA